MTAMQLLAEALEPETVRAGVQELTERMRNETGSARQATFEAISVLTKLRALLTMYGRIVEVPA